MWRGLRLWVDLLCSPKRLRLFGARKLQTCSGAEASVKISHLGDVTGASNTEPRRRSCVSCPVFGFPDFQKALGFTLNCHRVIHPKAQDFRKVWSSGGVFDVFRHRLGLKASSGVCQNVRIQSALQQLHILFAPSGTVNTSGRNIDKPETQNPNEVQLYRLPSSHGNPSNLDVYLYG